MERLAASRDAALDVDEYINVDTLMRRAVLLSLAAETLWEFVPDKRPWNFSDKLFYPSLDRMDLFLAALRDRRTSLEQWNADGFSVSTEIKARKGGFIEIGGPTFAGYFLLDYAPIDRDIAITNSEELGTYTMWDDESQTEIIRKLDDIVDGRNTGYEDESIGMVLASNLPYDSKSDLHPEADLLTIDAIAEGIISDGTFTPYSLASSLRFQVAREVWRILEHGGLYVTTGTTKEIQALTLLGFEKKAALINRGNEICMEKVILQKCPY